MTLAIAGHAIISADGMIADAAGNTPAALRIDADWRRFQSALDAAALVVLGRKGHARHPNPARRRLVLTHSVATLARDPGDNKAMLWNPAGMAFDSVLAELGISSGAIAIAGGSGTFDLFLEKLTAFDLVEVAALVLPGGVPCFSAGHPRVVLAEAGLRPVRAETLDVGVTLTRWERR